MKKKIFFVIILALISSLTAYRSVLSISAPIDELLSSPLPVEEPIISGPTCPSQESICGAPTDPFMFCGESSTPSCAVLCPSGNCPGVYFCFTSMIPGIISEARDFVGYTCSDGQFRETSCPAQYGCVIESTNCEPCFSANSVPTTTTTRTPTPSPSPTAVPSPSPTVTSSPTPFPSPNTTFRTPKHAYPQVNFSWTPTIPKVKLEAAQFSDASQCYRLSGNSNVPATCIGWSWQFGDNGTSTSQNPTHTYTVAGNYNATLQATDSDGYSCSTTRIVSVDSFLPTWREVSPKR